MEATVKQRLIAFLNYKGCSNSEFCRKMEVSQTFISSMRKSMQPDKLQKVAVLFPNLNMTWLLTGEGSMLVDEESVNERITVEGSGNRVAGRDYSEGAGGDGGGDHCTVVAALRSVIEEKNRHIDDLRALVAAKDETIAALKSHLQ